MFRIFLFLALLQAGAFGMWSTPKVLASNDRTIYIFSAFTQQEAPHYTHMVYNVRGTSSGGNLFHLAFDPFQNVVVRPHLLATNVSEAAIAGSDDSKAVYIVYKTNVDEALTPKVCFIESLDDGVTWSKPIAIGDPNNKVTQRVYANILYQKETGRIFIFYVSFLEDSSGRITMVTRPKGSAVFSTERFLYNSTTESFLRLELTYTREGKNSAVMHLQWCNNSDTPGLTDVKYIRSKDNGATWSPPMKLFTGEITMLISLAGSQNPATPVLASTAVGDRKSHLRISKNSGKTWSEALEYSWNEYRDLAICGGHSINSTRIFILALTGLPVIRFYYTTLAEGAKIIEADSPFPRDNSRHYRNEPFISCFMESKDVVHIVVATPAQEPGLDYEILMNYGRYTITNEEALTLED